MVKDPIEILSILTEHGMERSIIQWMDDCILPTEYWYDANDNSIHTDCGVSIPFDYDVRTQMARCRYDIIQAVKAHYEKQGIFLCSTDD